MFHTNTQTQPAPAKSRSEQLPPWTACMDMSDTAYSHSYKWPFKSSRNADVARDEIV